MTYSYDASDAARDLATFCEDCRRILTIENTLKQMKMEINSFGMHGGIAKATKDRSSRNPDRHEEKLLELLETEEQTRIEYSKLRERVRLRSAVLASLKLDPRSLKAITLRYESGCRYGFMGAVLRCTPIEAWQIIQDINEAYAANYRAIMSRKRK